MTDGDGDGGRGVGGLLWSVAKAVVQAVVVAVVLALFSPLIAREVARVNPTCDSTPGLVPVPVAEQILQGRASVTSDPATEERYAPERAFDSRLTSSWAVPVERPTRTTVEQTLQQAVDSARQPLATLAIAFEEPQDVRLLCVVNGHPLDPRSYRRADRVQRMDVALSCLDEPATVVLRTMPDEAIHDRQDVPVGCRGAETLELRLRQATRESPSPIRHGEARGTHGAGRPVGGDAVPTGAARRGGLELGERGAPPRPCGLLLAAPTA